MPAELNTYMSADRYERATPIRGVWDIEAQDSGVTLAVGVHFNDSDSPGAEAMQRIDDMIDDGDLATGGFREIAADRYYSVLLD